MRNASLDIFKLILSFFVIGIHCNFLSDYNESTSFYLNEGLFRIAVPFFILVTGYYFDRIETPKQLFNWALRIFILFVFWTLVYFPIWNKEPKLIIKAILAGNGYAHLWYVIHMMIAGVIFYYIKKYKFFNNLFFPILLFSLGCIIQYSFTYSHNETIHKFFRFAMMLYRNFLFVGLPFLMIGYYLKQNKSKGNWKLLVLSFLLYFSEVSVNYMLSRGYPNPIFDISFTLIIITPLIFLSIKQLQIPFNNGKQIALMASAVYFSHLWILNFLTSFGIQDSIHKWLITCLLSVLLSFPIIYVNSKLPYKIL